MAMTKDRPPTKDTNVRRPANAQSQDVEDIVQNGYMGVLEIISHLQNLATAAQPTQETVRIQKETVRNSRNKQPIVANR